MSNPRTTNGPKEGEPGDFIIVTLTDILPPQIFTALVMDDGYFDDDLYDEIENARREYRRDRLRDDGE
ncbi:hypothetical protein UFOVP1246_80 [uncultured Caudovirales phage]|jgi:hypothetical protein|uniref:Uncharacterized protein n=1 Tax=uncultured Caudovirales phage TaxID=2100421 RepID=A0A6J5R8N7_9CAUD|nr:hypothetical protein UFOVP1246_80 [uncultured Caudovirales phage]